MLLETSLNVNPETLADSVSLSRLDTKISSLLNGQWGVSTNGLQSMAVSAANYHLQAGGHRIRGRCAIHAGLMLGLTEADAICLAALSELLHNASLIHDDLQDRDDTRRGLPAVWKMFGPNVAICTGDLMLSAAYASLCGLSDSRKIPALLALVHQRTAHAIQGQCEDLEKYQLTSISLEKYIAIVVAKSGALLSLPIELVFVASGKEKWLDQARDAAEAFAVAYQISDDLADVVLDKESDSLNIIFILESTGSGSEAMVSACLLGNQYLDRAIVLSRELPFASGSILARLASELRSNFARGSS